MVIIISNRIFNHNIGFGYSTHLIILNSDLTQENRIWILILDVIIFGLGLLLLMDHQNGLMLFPTRLTQI